MTEPIALMEVMQAASATCFKTYIKLADPDRETGGRSTCGILLDLETGEQCGELATFAAAIGNPDPLSEAVGIVMPTCTDPTHMASAWGAVIGGALGALQTDLIRYLPE